VPGSIGAITRFDPVEVPLTNQYPAAVLFDMDGTLVDSEGIWDEALTELASIVGGVLSPSARRSMVGVSLPESVAMLHAELGRPWRNVRADVAWLEARVRALFSTGLRWRPGAAELLAAIRTEGIPTALVTSSPRSLVEVALDTLGRNSFDALVCGDEVAAPKPDPEPYRTAARLLGQPIGRCVAVEDSPTGVASAWAAGAVVLAVPNEVPLVPPGGVHLRRSLTEVSLASLSRLLPTARVAVPGPVPASQPDPAHLR
jgi:HAD superfamily hydrolase (TIGR01509 family)